MMDTKTLSMDALSTVRTYEQFRQDFPHWLLNVRNPAELFNAQPSYVVSQAFCIVGGLLSLAHALHRGGRWPFLWMAGALTGVLVEGSMYFSPYGETIWFSPTVIDLFHQRVPLFIFFVYPFFYYQAFWAASKLQLKCRWSEHIAAGLLVVLADLPFDMVSIKFLHWTLHDTEHLLSERVYSAPWTLLLFFAVASFAFSYLFHNLRSWMDRSVGSPQTTDRRWAVGTIGAELVAMVGAASVSLSVGTGLFLAFSYPLHTVLGIPHRIIVIGVFLCVAAVFWKFDRKSNRRMPMSQSLLDHALNVITVGHFLLYFVLAFVLRPEDTVSSGRHQPIGDCHHTTGTSAPPLCLDTFSRTDYDFHCISKPPNVGAYWYTVCGTPYENRAEFLFAMAVITFIAALVHWTIHYDFDVRFKVYDFVKRTSSVKGGNSKKVL
ncbi:uncharacterized protein LOC4576542 isoform X1 [Anopheles gambiae]|uniref:uncharacterized protein LOC4576542 isoform X1 n=1 Tax=Anopheles gambiae TaxID=7165 RepID=UPI002AC98684|nr:uncharacterized protein LOC4576542 isoform X1 [Anopheles gambiae]